MKAWTVWAGVKASAHFNPYWVAMWTVDTAILIGLIVHRTPPTIWLTAVVVLFGVPEAIGLRRRGDAWPPLTYVVRRYAPRWSIKAALFGLAVVAALVWKDRPHHEAIWVIDAICLGWADNHFDVTEASPGE